MAETTETTETIAVSTTICPVTATETPTSSVYVWSNSTSAPYGGSAPSSAYGASSSVYVVPTSSAVGTGAYTPTTSVCVPSSSVTAITKSYTTVLTTVEYSTVEVPCPTASVPAGGSGGYGSNGTSTGVPPVTGSASAFTGSAVFAVVAGVVALAFA